MRSPNKTFLCFLFVLVSTIAVLINTSISLNTIYTSILDFDAILASVQNNDNDSSENSDWIEPRKTNQKMIVLVMSARSHFDQRVAIRQTWAKGHENVYFVIGAPCLIPPENRQHPLACGAVSDDYKNTEYNEQLDREEEALTKEQQTHRDILLTPKPESYHGLPHKLKEAYDWVIQATNEANWIVKADDDMYIRIPQLSGYLSEFDPSQPSVLGHIKFDDPVRRTGKWKETKYRPRVYPNFPLGSWGHIVSRPVAAFVAKNKQKLTEYQGEDTSLGIWLHESPLRDSVKWKPSEHIMTNKGHCNPKMLVIGHGLSPARIRLCFGEGRRAWSSGESTSEEDKQIHLPEEPQDDGQTGEKEYPTIDPGQTQQPEEGIGRPNPGAWMPLRVTNETVVVFVMSARAHFHKRDVIRNSWASGHDNVYFVIGEPCPFPRHQRKNELTCEKMELAVMRSASQANSDVAYAEQLEAEQKKLVEEQRKHQDMIYTPRPESYRGLVHKLKEAYSWAISNTNTQWMAKADDDTVVRVGSLSKLLSKYSPTNPTVVGRIIRRSPVQKMGKWADMDYHRSFYPPWPQGSCGHVVSRPVAQFVADNKDKLYEYQGEDTTLAIWLDESPIKETVVWQDSSAFVNEGDCHNPAFVVIGHEITPSKMMSCYQTMDEVDVTRINL